MNKIKNDIDFEIKEGLFLCRKCAYKIFPYNKRYDTEEEIQFDDHYYFSKNDYRIEFSECECGNCNNDSEFIIKYQGSIENLLYQENRLYKFK